MMFIPWRAEWKTLKKRVAFGSPYCLIAIAIAIAIPIVCVCVCVCQCVCVCEPAICANRVSYHHYTQRHDLRFHHHEVVLAQ